MDHEFLNGRFSRFRMMIAVAILGLGLGAAHAFCTGLALVDHAYALIFEHDTVYADGYTEAGWDRLSRGMSGGQVERELGPPLKILPYSRGLEVWWYSESPGDTNYWRRSVHLRDGAVEGLDDRFHVD